MSCKDSCFTQEHTCAAEYQVPGIGFTRAEGKAMQLKAGVEVIELYCQPSNMSAHQHNITSIMLLACHTTRFRHKHNPAARFASWYLVPVCPLLYTGTWYQGTRYVSYFVHTYNNRHMLFITLQFSSEFPKAKQWRCSVLLIGTVWCGSAPSARLLLAMPRPALLPQVAGDVTTRSEIRGAGSAVRISQSSSMFVGCGGACGGQGTLTDRHD